MFEFEGKKKRTNILIKLIVWLDVFQREPGLVTQYCTRKWVRIFWVWVMRSCLFVWQRKIG